MGEDRSISEEMGMVCGAGLVPGSMLGRRRWEFGSLDVGVPGSEIR